MLAHPVAVWSLSPKAFGGNRCLRVAIMMPMGTMLLAKGYKSAERPDLVDRQDTVAVTGCFTT